MSKAAKSESAEVVKAKAERRANLFKRWSEAGKLTDDERAEIADLLPRQRRRQPQAVWAHNKAEGARKLSMDRKTFDKVIHAPGCPPVSANGKYNLTLISEFMASAGFRAGLKSRPDDVATDKRRMIRYQSLTAQMEYERECKTLVPIALVERVWADQLQYLRNRIKESAAIPDELKSELMKNLVDIPREKYFEGLADEVAA
jgi:hypothetical protein